MSNCKMCGNRTMRALGVLNGVSIGKCSTCDARTCEDCKQKVADPHARYCGNCRAPLFGR